MCASLCTADDMCNAYRYNKTYGCILGNASQLVGVNAGSNETTTVYINAALIPGMPFKQNKNWLQSMHVGYKIQLFSISWSLQLMDPWGPNGVYGAVQEQRFIMKFVVMHHGIVAASCRHQGMEGCLLKNGLMTICLVNVYMEHLTDAIVRPKYTWSKMHDIETI